MIKRIVCAALLLGAVTAWGQSLGNAGTIEGNVVDQTGAIVPDAKILLHQLVTGYEQTAATGADGGFRLVNVPPNRYHLEITAQGFGTWTQDVDVRNSIPIAVKAMLALASSETSIEVEGIAQALENDPSSHVDVDRNQLLKLPSSSPGTGLSQAIVYSTGGVSSDANGFFHPLGDHAQASFLVDGQPISDQQSKVFSTQLPTSAIQSMEVTTGTPAVEFGDKTSLVAQVTTRSGLGAQKVFGDVGTSYGSFGSPTGSVAVGFGGAKYGNFIALDGLGSGRFLDTPEFRPIHAIGNNETIFDRVDYEPSGKDALHLNIFLARNWLQIPNSLDQLTQDQRQKVLTWNLAPGYQHTFSATTLLTVNPYIRKDQVHYYGSRNPFADTPATQNQNRQLLNWGMKADVTTQRGRHTVKVGVDLKQTRLMEDFNFGITDAGFNSPCLTVTDAGVEDARLTAASQCKAGGYQANPEFSQPLLPFDLSRGGRLFQFRATGNVNQAAVYAQDAIKAGDFQFSVGVRLDHYDGLTSKTEPQPRAGVSYNLKKTGTVLRAAYARTMETPFNENLLLSSFTGQGGLASNVFGASAVPIAPGFRNQFNGGLQQAVGKYILIDADYFWKYTHNSYDFATLLNSTITFPIAWRNSKLDGLTGRVSTTNLKGFQAYWTFGHTRARFFPPENGGLIQQGAALDASVFRIDHDQAFQSTLTGRYQRPHNAEWITMSYRYDSGAVVSGVPDTSVALGLTPNQQVTIGLACSGRAATVANPITACSGPVTSTLLNIPTPGEANADHNPARVKPRNVFNLGLGTDNLLHRDGRRRVTAAFEITNLTNVTALYNFLSTFSGTHFLQPRQLTGRVGFTF
jgi:hypothetical protein